MTRKQQRDFVCELCNNIRDNVLEKIGEVPPDWDGHELRRYVADKFEAAAFTVGRKGIYGRDYRARTRNYRNAVLKRNL